MVEELLSLVFRNERGGHHFIFSTMTGYFLQGILQKGTTLKGWKIQAAAGGS